MRWVVLSILVFLAPLVSGCAIKPTDLAAIKVGASRQAVEKLLGEPVETVKTETGRIDTYSYNVGSSGGRYSFAYPIAYGRQRNEIEITYGRGDKVVRVELPEARVRREEDEKKRQELELLGQQQPAPPAAGLPVAAPMVQPREQATYRIYFASYESSDLAQKGWSQIWSKHRQMLTGVKPYIDYGSFRGDRPQHHLYGRGLTKAQAEALCRKLQQRYEPCAVVKF